MCAVEKFFMEDGFVKEDYCGGKGPVSFCRGEVVRIPEKEAETPNFNGVGVQHQETISSFSENDTVAMLWQLACPTAPSAKERLLGMESNIDEKLRWAFQQEHNKWEFQPDIPSASSISCIMQMRCGIMGRLLRFHENQSHFTP